MLIYDSALKKIVKLFGDGQLSEYADLSSMPEAPTAITYQPNLGRLLIFDNTRKVYIYSGGQLTFLKQLDYDVNVVAVNTINDSFYTGAQHQGVPINHYDKDGEFLSTIASNVQGCFQIAVSTSKNRLYYSETYVGQVIEVDLSSNSSAIIAQNVGISGTPEPISVGLDGSDNFYYFTANQGLNKYEDGNFTKLMNSIAGVGQIIWSPVYSAFLVANGVGANIISYNPVTMAAEHKTLYVNAVSIVEMDDGTVLVADGNYFGKFINKVDGSGFTPFTVEMQNSCFALERGPDGYIYAGLDDGSIWKINADGSVTAWATGYTTDPVVSLHYDSKNNAMISVTGNYNTSTAAVWRISQSNPSEVTKVTELSDVLISEALPAGAVDNSGNIYLLERQENIIYQIADGANTATVFISSALDNEAITVPRMEYISRENALVVSTIEDYQLWPIDNPVKSTFAINNGAVDNFAINETKYGNLIAIHSGQVFRLVYIIFAGDMNGDKIVDLEDAVLSLKVAGGVNTGGENMEVAADVNGDEKIGLEEVIYIMQKISGVR